MRGRFVQISLQRRLYGALGRRGRRPCFRLRTGLVTAPQAGLYKAAENGVYAGRFAWIFANVVDGLRLDDLW